MNHIEVMTEELSALLSSVNGDCYLGQEKEEKLVSVVRRQYATSPAQPAPATEAVRLLKHLGPKPWQTSAEAWAQARLIADFEEAYTRPQLAAQPTSLVEGMAKILVERLEEEQAVYLSMQTAKSFVQSMLLAQHSTGEPK
jgi:hypothetical protein